MSDSTTTTGVTPDQSMIAVVMVGLPARGKSLIAQKVVRYLKWTSIDARVFNVGVYRRMLEPHPSADFFDFNNKEGEKFRKAAASDALNDMIKWLKGGKGTIAVFDATNSTVSRRQWIKLRCDAEGIETLFVESCCDDEAIITANILEVKTRSPDYVGQDPSATITDFRQRIDKYMGVFQTIDSDGSEKDLTYMKIINVGSQVVINQIKYYIQSRVVYYLMNLHIKPRVILLSRHGESEYNLTGQIGGDANLSERGELYAKKLPELVRNALGPNQTLTVWTSTLKRTIATARYLPEDYNQVQWKALDELDAGLCDGLTYQQISDQYPEDFKARDEDKYNYRYSGGESYRDVVTRLEPIIMELERSENVLIVTHQAVLRCIWAYLNNESRERAPWMAVKLHSLIRYVPRAYTPEIKRFNGDIPAVSTFREKGSVAKHEDPSSASQEVAGDGDNGECDANGAPPTVVNGHAKVLGIDSAQAHAAAVESRTYPTGSASATLDSIKAMTQGVNDMAVTAVASITEGVKNAAASSTATSADSPLAVPASAQRFDSNLVGSTNN